MRVLHPVAVTDAMLISSNAPEPASGEVAWSASTSYAVGAIAYRPALHKRYRRLVAGATPTAPESDTENWAYVGATNRWGMFDDTSAATALAAGPLTVVFAPGIVGALAVMGLAGDTLTVTMTDGDGGPTVYSASVPLVESSIIDWYGYFFEPFNTRQVVLLDDLPPYQNGRITVTLAAVGAVAIAHCIAGTMAELGASLYGATAGIRDYSRKTVDEGTGVVTLSRGRYAQTLRARFHLADGAVNAVHRRLQALRSTPCVWVADDGGDIEPLVVYGYYRDFALDLQSHRGSFYSLEIEGMT